MSGKSVIYLTAAGLAVCAAYGIHRAKVSNPQQVEAQTVFFGTVQSTSVRGSVASADVRNSRERSQIMELPEAERARISGQGGLDSASYFNCWLTNGSAWTVTELRLHIAAGQTEGSTRWERYYNERVQLAPGTVERISFKVTDGGDGAESRWKVSGARGFPSN